MSGYVDHGAGMAAAVLWRVELLNGGREWVMGEPVLLVHNETNQQLAVTNRQGPNYNIDIQHILVDCLFLAICCIFGSWRASPP